MNWSNVSHKFYTWISLCILITNTDGTEFNVHNHVKLGSNSQGSRVVKYIGCMKRTSGSHSLKEKQNLPAGINVRNCVQVCWKIRRKFAGLQGGTNCYCSGTLADVVSVAESECYKRCNLNCQQMCGGESTFSVYQTGYRREPIFPMSKQALIKAQIGCYHLYLSSYYLCKTRLLSSERMTMAMCVYFCASVHNMKFATTRSVIYCCCSNSVSGARNNRMERCNTPCRGDTTKGFGCVGKDGGAPLMATVEISRLPPFKKFPASAFQFSSEWQRPLFPAGENFEVSDKPVAAAVSWKNNPSLQGLVMKRLTPPPNVAATATAGGGGEGEVVGDKAVVSLAGGDQRENALGGVGKSVAVSEVSGRAESAAPTKDEGNTLIIVAVAVAFVIILVATGLYFYRNSESDLDDYEDDKKKRKKKKKKKKKKRTSIDSSD